MPNMHYDKGMIPDVSGKGHGTAGFGKGAQGVKQATRGASVRSGLSKQESFHGMSNHESGHCTVGKNQVPTHPRKRLNTSKGDFVCY